MVSLADKNGRKHAVASVNWPTVLEGRLDTGVKTVNAYVFLIHQFLF